MYEDFRHSLRSNKNGLHFLFKESRSFVFKISYSQNFSTRLRLFYSIRMVLCSAFGCKNRSENKVPGITFHRFPLKDPTKNGIWLKNMHLADWFPTKNSRICSKHFETHAFYKVGNRTSLLDDAVPTIFEELPKHLQTKVTKRPHPRSRQLITPTASISRKNDPPQEDPDTPRKKHLRRQLFAERVKSQEKSREIKVLNQRVRRLKRHIVSLKQVLKASKQNNLVSSESSVLLENMPEVTKELQKRKLGKKHQYSPELRKFAITLCFFSPRGYDYVRNAFESCLPHRSTIGKWFKTINAEPGFSSEAINVLKKNVEYSDKPVCTIKPHYR
ncbi:unnamed protein product [Acanthoscelides obtectus]|uniref:THAP-type domain-containing protein n=1 Tax=Acanthoscelides obtectus TaxID=200917 RepID=A0A9P0KN13_ACAOB|nr:unnamed protein product [Acanthoscelides obtectus]CAK1667570.1 DNA transposase THAP9 [Acanthoscelides obtectus]